MVERLAHTLVHFGEGTAMCLFLGLDLSTTALKAIAIDRDGHERHSATVQLDTLTPTPVAVDPDTHAATTPPSLFIDALDALLHNLRDRGFPFHELSAVSGSAQQHGSVFVSNKLEPSLASLDPALPLAPQLVPSEVFAFERSPTWMDASTSAQCAQVEETLGGAARVAKMTGSRAYERFTGVQILKRAQEDPTRFAQTQRVALISAFIASLLCGHLVPEDVAEASGTNMFNIADETGPPHWWPEAVRAMKAEGKLADAPVPGATVVGHVASYFQKRYAICANVPVIAFSGDNPCSLAAMGGLERGDMLISLGTSDTVQFVTDAQTTSEHQDQRDDEPIGHTFRSPLSSTPTNIRMLVFSNGSQTRAAVRDGTYVLRGARPPSTPQTWASFDAAIQSTAPGCEPPRVGHFALVSEILPRRPPSAPYVTPPLPTTHAELCRLVVESRALTIRAHAPPATRILLTGGASASTAIPQILADVLGAPVHAIAPQSAALGAAHRARGTVAHPKLPPPTLPNRATSSVYAQLLNLLQAPEQPPLPTRARTAPQT